MVLHHAAWGGVDTVVVSAGALTIHPLFTIVGARGASMKDPDVPSPDDVQRVADVALGAAKGNFIGPLVTAVTMVRPEIFSPSRASCHSSKFVFVRIMRTIQIPVLNRSPSPSILLVSSLAAVIPAPTRTLYVSTKAASLTLYQSMSIEHSNITFTVAIPSTVEDFEAKLLTQMPSQLRLAQYMAGIIHSRGTMWPSGVSK